MRPNRLMVCLTSACRYIVCRSLLTDTYYVDHYAVSYTIMMSTSGVTKSLGCWSVIIFHVIHARVTSELPGESVNGETYDRPSPSSTPS
ncbi:hypothetical protein F5146DRAFT_1029630 [Armillaria mellea]|nr:hypothetical protein F5146DRAFT_1029630 [Armillaria mellea]